MADTQLPSRPAQYFIDEFLVPEWDPSNAMGFDPSAQPGDDAFCPVGTSLDDVGRTYPSITVQRTNETSGGQTGYDFLTANGPGQNRDGQLLVSAYVEDDPDGEGYTGDSGTYSAVDAETLVATLIDEAEGLVLRNANAPGTDFSFVGSYLGADAPDDFDAEPTVRVQQCIVLYSWIRAP
jgi:hypothetical protein